MNAQDTPLVSVVIPCYNAAPFVKEAVMSVMQQSYTNLEIILIDDFSTDSTWAILEQSAVQDKRIKLIRNEKNMGVVATLNKGIALSKGKYIARMDADDISLSHRIKVQVDFFEQDEALALCGSNYIRINNEGKKTGKVKFPSDTERLKAELLFYCPFAHPSVMMKKAVLDELGYYHTGMILAQDYELWLRIAKQFKVANVQSYLLLYRWHGNNISITKKEKQAEALEKALHCHTKSFGFAEEYLDYHLKFLAGAWPKKTNADEIKKFDEWKNALINKNKALKIFDELVLRQTFDKYASLAFLSILKSKANNLKIKFYTFLRLLKINPRFTINHFLK